ncbi:MAG: hypothetical protein AAF799_34855 [Myxococcota bacterium]
MTNVDQFESVFRSAAKPVFVPEDVDLTTVLVVSDQDAEGAGRFKSAVQKILSGAGSVGDVQWPLLTGSDFRSPGELLERVEAAQPQLVCSYRNLHSDGWRWPHSLGESLDVLTQVVSAPVLVCPNPNEQAPEQLAERGTARVMAVTDHLAGDDRLVNWAVKIAENDGHLLLTHVEDEVAYERMIDVISKIPALETSIARRTIHEQLLKEPHDYIQSCRTELSKAGARVKIDEIVTMGHRLADYKRLVSEHDVDVLALHTRDEDQMAMHGMAHPIAVELREIPLLML